MHPSSNQSETRADDPPNIPACLAWLRKRSLNVKFGKDTYLEILIIIRTLMLERTELNKQIEKLEAEVAALQLKLKPKKTPYDVGGQGQWGVQ